MASINKINDENTKLKDDYDDNDDEIKKLKSDNKALGEELKNTESNIKTSDKQALSAQKLDIDDKFKAIDHADTT